MNDLNLQSNERIAKFMGYTIQPNGTGEPSLFYENQHGLHYFQELVDTKYHLSWDALMPVWINILQWGVGEFGYRWVQEITETCVQIKCVKCKESENPKVIVIALKGELKLDDVYLAVVWFLDWYEPFYIKEYKTPPYTCPKADYGEKDKCAYPECQCTWQL